MFRLRTLVCAVLAVASATLDASLANAAGNPNAAKGLVAEHCSKCHAVPGYSAQGLPTLDAPPFRVIADDPKTYTEQRLRASMLQPHWPMAQFRLSPSDIDNIVAYLKSLATE